ncbi:MAG: DUF58 domain-containing protein [Acidimicrobiales bacterium]
MTAVAPAPPARSPRSPAAEALLRQLEVTIGRKLDGLLHGDHQGALPGPRSEAGEGRPYEPGDDVRRIDWNLTARSGDVHVRDTVAERELETWFVVDGSASLDYGTASCEARPGRGPRGRVRAAHGPPGQPHRCRGVRRLRARVVPPRRVGPRSSSWWAACTTARATPAGSRRSPPPSVASTTSAPRRARGGGLGPAGPLGLAARLRVLGQRHDVVVARLTDPREEELPPVGVLALVDPETGRLHEVQTSNRRFRERYAEAAAERRARIDERLRSSRASHLELATDGDWLRAVVAYVNTRRRRR